MNYIIHISIEVKIVEITEHFTEWFSTLRARATLKSVESIFSVLWSAQRPWQTLNDEDYTEAEM